MNEYVVLAVFTAGLAAVVGAVAYVAAGALIRTVPGIAPKTFRHIWQLSKPQWKENKGINIGPGVNAAFILGSVVGGIFGAIFGWGSPTFYSTVGTGSTAGALMGWFFYNNLRESSRLKLLREVAVLYESVEFYTRAGYTIQQSLELGAVLTPLLRSRIDRCMSVWTSGPARALEAFAHDVDLPEAAILSSVLVHAELGLHFVLPP